MNLSRTLVWCALALAVHALPSPAATPADRPNILFIMSDDHAAHAIGAYGSKVNQTPNMDRIADQGMRLDDCFCTNSICTPSRATILTGKYSHLNGVPVFNAFDGNQPHVAKYLQAGGYYTGMIGKWHLGTVPTGFDFWEVLPGQGQYFNAPIFNANGRHVTQGYVSDALTDIAFDFLDHRPQDKPFFLMLHHKAPHRPWEPNEKYKAEFANKHIPEPETLYDDYATRTDALHENKQRVFDDLTRRDLKLEPPAGLSQAERQEWLKTKPKEVETEIDGKKVTLTGDALNKWKYQRYMQDYLACVQSVDDNVGKVLDYLDSHHLADNTVVIYTSDQGFYLGDHGLFDKRFMYEFSLRMPFLVRWPGHIPAHSTSTAMCLNTDFAPTFLDLAGLPTPPDMQGRSMLPVLEGKTPPDWRTAMYYRYYHDPGDHNTRAHYGIRTPDRKLIYFWKKNQWEFYDLTKDPNELNNLYNDPARQDEIAKLKDEMYRLKKELKDDDQFADHIPPQSVDGPPRPNKPQK